ncbi:MAG: hypothetical protein Q4B87_02595 [Candidatus Saccharibacteria bacterium]|nr:hypothetical protein [Candidatus Saccharibacteria bacterium]
MEKKYLKRLGYGFSALVLGLSAVNFFPAINAYATGGEPEQTVSSTLSVNVTTPAGTDADYTISEEPFVVEGTFEGEDLIITVDNVPIDVSQIEIVDGEFTAEIEFEEAGTYAVKVMALRGESVAAREITVTVKESGPVQRLEVEPEYRAEVVSIGEKIQIDSMSNLEFSKRDGGEWDAEWIPVTEEDLAIAAVESGKIEITPLKAGRYTGTARRFVMEDGILKRIETYLDLTVIDAQTESAKTIIDIHKSYNEMNQKEIDANKQCGEIYNSDKSEEEKNALCDKIYGGVMEIIKNTEAKEISTFGDSAMAIEEAIDAGKAITTNVTATELAEADIDDSVKGALLSQIDVTYSNVKFYDVDVNVYADGEKIGTLKELTNDEVVVISGFSGPAAGFKRVFQVVRYHTYVSGFDETTGEPIEEVEVTVIDDAEFNVATGEVSFASDKFSTYAVAYKDVLAASVNTGEFTSEGASASASVSVSVIAAIAAIALFGAVKFVKAKRN